MKFSRWQKTVNLSIVCMAVLCSSVYAGPIGGLGVAFVAIKKSLDSESSVDLNVLKQIESSGNPSSFNTSSQARGLYQITPIVLKEFNNFKGTSYSEQDLFNPAINTTIAIWYLEIRIPQMLRHFKKEVSVRNILISYNAGISYVVSRKKLPKETQEYLAKYEKLSRI